MFTPGNRRRQACRCRPAGLLALAALIMACGTSALQVRDLSPDEVQTVLARLRTQARRLQTLEGRVIISIEAPEYRQRGGANLILQYPDSLRLTFEGPLGIDVADFLVSPNRVQFYNRRDNTTFLGPYSQSTVRQLLGLDLRLDEVLHLLVGQREILEQLVRFPLKGRTLRDRIILTGEKDGRLIEIELEPRGRYVTAIRWRNADGTIFQEQIYQRFKKIRDLYFPDFIQFQRRAEKRQITIQFRSRRINRSIAPHRFRIPVPASAKNIVL